MRQSGSVRSPALRVASSEPLEIRGGKLQDYYGGLAERVGAPEADPVKGLRSGNYGVLTTPRAEYELVISGGKGLKEGDARVLRPLEYYDDLETVKDAGLTRVEIVIVIMYTGPMFHFRCPLCVHRVMRLTPARARQLYNARLRDFGHCGVVEEGEEPVTVKERCDKAGNTYASSFPALARARQ